MRGLPVVLFRRTVLLVAAAMLGLLAWAGVASAKPPFLVTTTSDSNDGACTMALCSLRDAVVAADAAGGGSTISLPVGTYKLTIPSTGPDDPTTGDLDINNNASVTITGAGSGTTIIDANGIDRAFAVQKGAGLTLSGMTIEHGNPSSHSSGGQNGGAIYSDGVLTLTGDVTLHDNTALGSGGAIYTGNDQTVLSLTGATFENNTAGSGGGALELNTATNDSSVRQSITDSTLTSNNASGTTGGAIDLEAGSLTVSGSTFTGNTASSSFLATGFGDGGAIFAAPNQGDTLTLTNNSFVANSAFFFGGALFYGDGDLTASGNAFTGNTAEDGGAILAEASGPPSATASLFNNTFDGNSASDVGGALANEGNAAAWSFYNNTLAHNQASVRGGGIYAPGDVGPGSFNTNNNVADNVGGDCVAAGEAITAAEDPGNNLDSDGSCFGQNTGDLTNTNPDLGPLADNGGPTETDALLAGSPAINAGNDAHCPASDQRGVARPQGAHCDIGAFEAAAAGLSVSNTAPASGTANAPFTYTVTVTDHGLSPSTGTTITDQLPAGETLYGATPSQGSCTSSGSPARVTCALGTINASKNATVTLLVAEANPGSVTDTATATNDQGTNVSAPATTTLASPATTTVVSPPTPSVGAPAPTVGAPTATTGGHSHVTKHSAKLSGTVSTGRQTTWYFFQYGTTRSLGAASGFFKLSSSSTVAATIQHLLAGKEYYFRLVAINDNGVSTGGEHTFHTNKNHHT
jgi:CSLREA domain-containing protein/uncharacterized repeat protein (TIGR01451 family)